MGNYVVTQWSYSPRQKSLFSSPRGRKREREEARTGGAEARQKLLIVTKRGDGTDNARDSWLTKKSSARRISGRAAVLPARRESKRISEKPAHQRFDRAVSLTNDFIKIPHELHANVPRTLRSESKRYTEGELFSRHFFRSTFPRWSVLFHEDSVKTAAIPENSRSRVGWVTDRRAMPLLYVQLQRGAYDLEPGAGR